MEIESLLKTFTDSDGKRLLVKSYNGYNLPYTFIGNVKDHAEALKKLTTRPDDVFVCTYPRCGTHWMREVASMLMRGNADYIDKTIADSPLEVTPIEVLDKLPSPRVMYCHLHMEFLPENIKNSGKVINVVRNPKDCAVSFYHISKAYGDGKYGQKVLYDGSWEEWLKLFQSGNVPYDSYFRYQRQMEEFQQNNPDYPILTVEFEKLKKDFMTQLKTIADFLGVKYTDKLLEEIAEKCHFSKLKQQKAKELTDYSKDTSKDGSEIYYRKGDIGDWKNWLRVAENERFDEVVAKEMGGCKYTPIYT